jgi:predicted RNase H-like HicB family nuclease
MDAYAIVIFFSAEDGEYIADILDLRFCSASGPTPEKALHEVLIAKDMWLESAQKHNIPIPEPHYKLAVQAKA